LMLCVVLMRPMKMDVKDMQINRIYISPPFLLQY
jgi:hypothetical protein